jgi:hypothetical protein
MARFFWDKESHVWVEFDPHAPRPPSVGPMVLRDIEPYRNVYNGERIRSRRHHRDFLRAHRLVEVGNEFTKALDRGETRFGSPEESPAMTAKGRRDSIEQAIAQVAQGGARSVAGTEGDI